MRHRAGQPLGSLGAAGAREQGGGVSGPSRPAAGRGHLAGAVALGAGQKPPAKLRPGERGGETSTQPHSPPRSGPATASSRWLGERGARGRKPRGGRPQRPVSHTDRTEGQRVRGRGGVRGTTAHVPRRPWPPAPLFPLLESVPARSYRGRTGSLRASRSHLSASR